MMFAGFFKNWCCYGIKRNRYKLIECSKDKFLYDAEVNFDCSFCDLRNVESDKIFFTSYHSAKTWLTGNSNCQKATLSKEVFKRFNIDLDNDDAIIAFCFYQMAIDFYVARAKKELRALNNKLGKVRLLIDLQKQQDYIASLIEAEQNTCLDLNNYNVHTAFNPIPAKRIKRSIPLVEASKYGFEQIIANSRFYMNKEKRLWMSVGDYLVALNSNDYIGEK